MAVGLLADVATGRPELLSELTLTTAIRTAATSVMAAKQLARKNARSMALIGNWRAKRVPGPGLPSPAGHQRNPPL